MLYLNDLVLAIIATILVYVINYLYIFYSRLKYYPNGPIPLPIFGNLLMMTRKLNQNPSYFFKNLAKNYDGIYTFWFGSQPMVFISSVELGKKAFNQIECCDRWNPVIESKLTDALFENNKNIVFMNWSEEYKKLRKVSVNGIRKYLATNKLSETSNRIVDETVNRMIINEKHGKLFIANEYIASIFVRILSETIFGKQIEWNDPGIKQIQKSFEIVQINTLKVFITEFFPILKLFIDPMKQKQVGIQTADIFNQWIRERLEKKQITDNYDSVTDIQIQLRNTLCDINEDNHDYLNDKQLFGNINVLFFASSDTVYNSFKWIFLFMAYYPEMQQKLRLEIKANIGDKSPEIADKEKCDFVNAFICESLRFRNVTPFGVYHSSLIDTHIDKYKIPKGCLLVLQQDSILNDEKYWENPHIFNPNRFLNHNQKFSIKTCDSFIPFSTGKRMCIGDKFAMNLLFLILTRLLQATIGYRIELTNKFNTDLEPKTFGFFTEPKPYYVETIKD